MPWCLVPPSPAPPPPPPHTHTRRGKDGTHLLNRKASCVVSTPGLQASERGQVHTLCTRWPA